MDVIERGDMDLLIVKSAVKSMSKKQKYEYKTERGMVEDGKHIEYIINNYAKQGWELENCLKVGTFKGDPMDVGYDVYLFIFKRQKV